MKRKKITYEVVYGKGGFANVAFDTIKEAREYQANKINNQEKNTEFFDYWEDVRLDTKIQKVTTIREDII